MVNGNTRQEVVMSFSRAVQRYINVAALAVFISVLMTVLALVFYSAGYGDGWRDGFSSADLEQAKDYAWRVGAGSDLEQAKQDAVIEFVLEALQTQGPEDPADPDLGPKETPDSLDNFDNIDNHHL